MKKIIFWIILFFSLWIFSTFALYIKPDQEFVINDETYFFKKEGNQSKIYKKSDLSLSWTYTKFDYLFFDVWSKKYFYKQNNQFYVINDDFTTKYIFNRYQNDHYSTLYKLEPFNKFNLPSWFSYSQDNVFNNNYLFIKYNNQIKIFTIRTFTKNNETLDYEYPLDWYYYKTIVAIDDETVLALKWNAENWYNTFTYNFITQELVENHDNFYKDWNNEIELLFDYWNKYTIKSWNNIKTWKIWEKLKCENREITSEYARSFWDWKNFVLDNYEHAEWTNSYSITLWEEWKKVKHRISLYYVENLTWFDFEDLTRKENWNYLTFDPLNWLWRHLGINFLYNSPQINIFTWSEISWIKIDWELPNWTNNFWYLVSCEEWERIDWFPDIYIWRVYKLPETDTHVCFRYNYNLLNYWTAKIKIDFWDFWTQTLNHKICENENWELIIDWNKTDFTKENLDEYFTPVDVDTKELVDEYNRTLNLEKIKIDSTLKIDYSKSKMSNLETESWKCKLFSDSLSFLYFSNWTTSIDFSFKQFSILDNFFWGFLDFFTNIIIWPINNVIWLTRTFAPFISDNQQVCLFWEVKTIEFHKMMKWTEYYWKMTIFDYIVLFAFWIFLLKIFSNMSAPSLNPINIEFDKNKNIPKIDLNKYKKQ